MKTINLIAATAALSLFAMPAFSQQMEITDEQLGAADEAAGRVATERYVPNAAPHWMPSDVVARLRELGYVNIRDFDVEDDVYEVEATSADGDDVEIEIDPITGAILDIDEDWF